MASIRHDSAETVTPLARGWRLRLCDAGAFHRPGEVGDDGFLPAIMPGTVAASLRAEGLFDPARPTPLHGRDVWYKTTIEGDGPRLLRFSGLATIAEVFLDGESILTSDNMYLDHEIEVTLAGRHELAMVFRSLDGELARRTGKRARWRPRMIARQGLRLIRTTLLGHMPGWCPSIDIVGPIGGVSLIERQAEAPGPVRIEARLEGNTGILTARSVDAGFLHGVLCCAGGRAHFSADGGMVSAELRLPGIDKWWPHTHGTPHLHDVEIQLGERRLGFGKTGFRSIEIDHGPDGAGFGLVVNGVPVFARGAVWTPPDLITLGRDEAGLAPSLTLALAANVNMLRVGGTMLYESAAFHALCDRLGILVFQDAMLANFDYPATDAAWAASFGAEIEQLLERTQLSPSLAVLTGGSEVAQQAAMLGLPPSFWTSAITDEILPRAIERYRPGLASVKGSPFGGPLPFSVDHGVSHYYGVGAYERPLEDARRAEVRFASECLAFANVPEPVTARTALDFPAVHDPRWKAGVPRDIGASWDFEDTRDHYLGRLYGVDPARLRREDPARYLTLSRAAVAEVMGATFGEWRRPGSPTRGGLVWFWQDLAPGCGWGIVDGLFRPKSAWYALRRAFQPVRIRLGDEGVNGARIDVVNDGAEAVRARVELRCLKDGETVVARGERLIEIAPRGSLSLAATDLIGGFFDVTYAYRFGPPSHEVVTVRLIDAETGETIGEDALFPQGRGANRHDLGLVATVETDDAGAVLVLSTRRFAQSVHIDAGGLVPSDNWFHLAPGVEKRVRLAGDQAAEGEVGAVNGRESLHFSVAR
ncbi:MAG: glycoside hydrolase family 2 protein [Hyphomicrobiaceae bacterium]|nr:glycoside hydrolase family 2 protein [Hyphomicrobiaceae bacterium]